ncbi:hypothetical protein DFH09DRAFT_1096424 [Mycena vulgaris]|nr:hypothetical protein DFH09DRAFT_1096424 [Mycena vulgaris]
MDDLCSSQYGSCCSESELDRREHSMGKDDGGWYGLRCCKLRNKSGETSPRRRNLSWESSGACGVRAGRPIIAYAGHTCVSFSPLRQRNVRQPARAGRDARGDGDRNGRRDIPFRHLTLQTFNYYREFSKGTMLWFKSSSAIEYAGSGENDAERRALPRTDAALTRQYLSPTKPHENTLLHIHSNPSNKGPKSPVFV